MSQSGAEPLLEDKTSFQNASRGLIASLKPCIIKGKDGQDVWNNEEYAFLEADCPSTAHPKLWRQGRLTSKQGLFKVTNGIYQIRGFDISNITFIESRNGIIVLECLQSVECAAKALDFYRSQRGGERRVKALIYSHCHYDHFSGALGVLPTTSQDKIPIIAPAGFLEEVLKEKAVVGPAMLNRAVSMFGEWTKRSHMVPDTEAPSEFNLFFPDHRALCIAECATNTMHNIVTLRGAAVRDAKRWSKHLDETIVLYGGISDVLFSSHHWPTWGCDELVKFISDQRDLYANMHDQTVRLMNKGLTGIEIAEQLRLPPALQREWHTQEFYGALNQNVRGIYQRYMTWFDGNAANLWKHVPAEEGKRYLACMGGADVVMRKAQEYVDRDDLRFAVALLDHIRAAEPQNVRARYALAQVYETLAFGAVNAVWRNYYLTSAQTLRDRVEPDIMNETTSPGIPSISPHSPVEDWLDALSIRLDGPRASDLVNELIIVIDAPDQEEVWTLRLRNGTLTYRSQSIERKIPEQRNTSFDLKTRLSKVDLFALFSLGNMDAVRKNFEGNIEAMEILLKLSGVT